MTQQQYETRKALLKRIRAEWGNRVNAARLAKDWERWADAVQGYQYAQQKVRRFIKGSLGYQYACQCMHS